jgi:hypothetical protein
MAAAATKATNSRKIVAAMGDLSEHAHKKICLTDHYIAPM